METKKKDQSNMKLLLQYAGFAMQAMVALSVAFYIGFKIDEWMGVSFPLIVWVLPLIVIIAMIWKVTRDTSKK